MKLLSADKWTDTQNFGWYNIISHPFLEHKNEKKKRNKSAASS